MAHITLQHVARSLRTNGPLSGGFGSCNISGFINAIGNTPNIGYGARHKSTISYNKCSKDGSDRQTRSTHSQATASLNASSEIPGTSSLECKLLESIDSPSDLKNLEEGELLKLCDEIRDFLKHSINPIGGHYSGNLGVVELTVALHYIFNSPDDRIVWDIGHQAYIHKILTGRRNHMKNIRQKDGISGFCRIWESPHDQFGAGHSSTSIGALQGLYMADYTLKKDEGRNYICIIGDGGMTGGLAYESLSYSCTIKSPLVIIYNDNEQSSLPTGLPAMNGVGPVTPFFMYNRSQMSTVSGNEAINLMDTSGPIDILGPIDGHNMQDLLNVFKYIRGSSSRAKKPIIVHVKTIKGRGCDKALQSLDRLHAITPFSLFPMDGQKAAAKPQGFSELFIKTLIDIAETDPKVVAITAGMPSGTAVGKFGMKYPTRTFDVGIAEQHAVTFSAGLALGGAKPFCCLYSTFLQRALDQVIHDVALQNAPVRLIVDRAGLVGNDGSSHHGSYDLSFLRPIHNCVFMVPSSGTELVAMTKLAHSIDDKMSVIRYPKLAAEVDPNLSIEEIYSEILKFKSRVVQYGDSKVAVLCLGPILSDAAKALEILNLKATLVDVRFLNPLDTELIDKIAQDHDVIFTAEDGTSGGFGSAVLEHLSDTGVIKRGIQVKTIRYPRAYIHHATQKEQRELAGVDHVGIANQIKQALCC
ncbi:1-deoxyxylulose-5-phosphate synthase, putative [Theileria equi strain WA]|uniref:1-deoxy-D-xylulose-5-phosphate synthase n=1 Tax=Theileria equi strain WA TaxID=1537102 RepID=L0AZ47_THEEQ|nr:1-deoxyxylulose-5-phosphate synthase, putative [Theileria equi strain WA]AFZ80862.1 1-deoxyxylulose-5-phosphate synthase, putative [Theileria equi strain WA]|eukprot:XP_004830528.1 1-deoxyxylulose-5-phosphate synthase, putative [Theileria equi strain WA]